MKKFFIQILALIIVAFVALSYATNNSLPKLLNLAGSNKSSKMLIDGITLNIEVANSADKRKKGLSGRESLATSSGMLFVFDKPGFYSLWMKGMKFPLDFIWIKNKTIIDLNKNVPPQAANLADTELPIYTPKDTIDSVLEVNSGFIDANNIKIGDTLILK